MSVKIGEHIVLYTDGGFLIDQSIGGAGAHGYTYTALSDKPVSFKGWIPTPMGYLPKNEKAKETESVTITGYVDLVRGLNRVTSSSESELYAIEMALKWIEEQEVPFKSVNIYTDSQNIVSGITKWINGWKKKNWISSTGKPVKFTDLWKRVDAHMERIRKTTTLNFTWIKGHAGHLGNETSDGLANRGIILEKNKVKETIAKVSAFKSYWSPASADAPPRLLDAPRMYTATFDESAPDPDKPVTYYMGSHGAKERLAEEQGKVYPCNYLAIVRMNKPDPVVNAMTTLVLEVEKARGGTKGTLVTYNLQNLLNAKFYAESLKEGLVFTERLSYPIRVSSVNAAPLVEEIVPVGRAFRLVDYCTVMKNKLNDLDEGKFIKRQSMLELFFDDVTKKDKSVERKLKKGITSATKTLKVEGEFSTDKKDLTTDTFKRKLVLILGRDTPSRNTLSALAKQVEALDLISWRESSTSVRYGVYLKLTTGEDGIWVKYDANLIMKKVK